MLDTREGTDYDAGFFAMLEEIRRESRAVFERNVQTILSATARLLDHPASQDICGVMDQMYRQCTALLFYPRAYALAHASGYRRVEECLPEMLRDGARRISSGDTYRDWFKAQQQLVESLVSIAQPHSEEP